MDRQIEGQRKKGQKDIGIDRDRLIDIRKDKRIDRQIDRYKWKEGLTNRGMDGQIQIEGYIKEQINIERSIDSSVKVE